MKPLASHSLLFALAFLIPGCRSRPSPQAATPYDPAAFVASVTCGDPGMKYTGTIVADHHTNFVSGVGNHSFTATGDEVSFVFKKTGSAGQIALSVSRGGEGLGGCSTANQFGEVHANIVSHLLIIQDSFNAF